MRTWLQPRTFNSNKVSTRDSLTMTHIQLKTNTTMTHKVSSPIRTCAKIYICYSDLR